MNPIELPPAMLKRISEGVVVAVNVGQPPAVTIRVAFTDPSGVDAYTVTKAEVMPLPDLSQVAIVAVAVTDDLRYIDIVYFNKAEIVDRGKKP